ncbi:MAG: aminopeptidase P family protein [Deltaproteobacteria bacterium]|nr:aminopeptidase P family protein [Deltaproteobacteria bacterium]TLN05127.1 MAG: aminopeptidase P family protein [bacterium]
MLKNRVAAARELLERFEIDAILVSDLKDVRYLTGFSGSEGLLLLSNTEVTLLVDSRYTVQAKNETTGCTVVEFREKKTALENLVAGQGVTALGIQAERVTVSFYNELSKHLPSVRFVQMGADLALLRVVKDTREITCLEKIANIASEALLGTLQTIKPGDTEKDIALRLEFAMRRAGADDKSFDSIVASGQRGALPHGRATGKPIALGELITIDFGALLDGYNSDETVTVACGDPDETQRKIYQIVKDAHDKAIDAVRPGVRLKDLDSVAREYISQKGYGDYFGHGLGHGVGLDIHEKPVVSFRSEDVVREGMVFTIEPGIYIPGWGGVRIEDLVVATSEGCCLLSRVPKDLMIL